jgi:endonuclease/exonuclease/phosphatase family metal-dependent hydrolase
MSRNALPRSRTGSERAKRETRAPENLRARQGQARSVSEMSWACSRDSAIFAGGWTRCFLAFAAGLVSLLNQQRHPSGRDPGLHPPEQDSQASLRPAAGCSSWIICGDLNATAESAVLQGLTQAGFCDAYATHPHAFTCNANRKARRIDFLLHTSDLLAEPTQLPVIDNDTPLPSAEEPSDHPTISAKMGWAPLSPA